MKLEQKVKGALCGLRSVGVIPSRSVERDAKESSSRTPVYVFMHRDNPCTCGMNKLSAGFTIVTLNSVLDIYIVGLYRFKYLHPA